MLSSQGDMVFPNHSISLSFHHTGPGNHYRSETTVQLYVAQCVSYINIGFAGSLQEKNHFLCVFL